MAQQQDSTIDKIRTYCKEMHELHDDPMELDASNTEARLTKTVRELRARVEEQQAALEAVRMTKVVGEPVLTSCIATSSLKCRH